MMGSVKRILIGLLSSFGGLGAVSTGGLPGSDREEVDEPAVWVDWGGSHLRIPEVRRSQQAFEHGAYGQAYKSLRRVRRGIRKGRIKTKSSTFRAQLDNNLAVSAHNLGQSVQDASKRRKLHHKAQRYVTRAAKRRTTSLELSDAITRNVRVIKRK